MLSSALLWVFHVWDWPWIVAGLWCTTCNPRLHWPKLCLPSESVSTPQFLQDRPSQTHTLNNKIPNTYKNGAWIINPKYTSSQKTKTSGHDQIFDLPTWQWFQNSKVLKVRILKIEKKTISFILHVFFTVLLSNIPSNYSGSCLHIH